MLNSKTKIFLLAVILTGATFIAFQGCSDNPLSNTETEVLLYERSGLIDSFTGTCAAYLIRRHMLDTIDFTSYKRISIEFEGSTDGDSSRVEVLYVDNNNIGQVLVNVEGENINNMVKHDLTLPHSVEFLELRLRLFASECTGYIYHLSIRDFKIYGYF